MKKYLPASAEEAKQTLFSSASTEEEKNTCLAYLGVEKEALLLFIHAPRKAYGDVGRLVEQAMPETRFVTFAGEEGIWLLMSDDGQTDEENVELCEAMYADIADELALDVRFGYARVQGGAELNAAMEATARTAELVLAHLSGTVAAWYERVFSYELLAWIATGEESPLIRRKKAVVLGMDEELRKTAAAFLECDLNISLASRKLYLHRNSMIYRLDKIQAVTGFDLRSFQDAFCVRLLLSVEEKHEV